MTLVFSQVISALRKAGLESSNLILGIDFTKSNEWTGDSSFPLKTIEHPFLFILISGRKLSFPQ